MPSPDGDATITDWEAAAAFMGPAYLRYAFTKGTDQEVGFLAEVCDLTAGQRLLDVGCGPGRHARGFAALGLEVVGVDLARRFVELAAAGAPARASFVQGDARRLPVAPGTFDVVVSLCQGGFGLLGGDDDGAVLTELARALRPGGVIALSAFSAYFQVRWLEAGDRFDASTGVNLERTELRTEAGERRPFDLSTTCFTPRELRLLCERAGLTVRRLWSVAPGAYRPEPPTIDTPEFLVVATRA